jgi:photosystem II stability/assembly factor-like uncharacterized protein
LRDVEFINDSLGYIVGTIWGLACIYATQDGGNSWYLQETFPEYSSIDGIELSGNLGWIITNSTNSDDILRSTEFGRSWEVMVDSINSPVDIAVYGDRAWFSYHNRVLRTMDAGNTWESFKIFDYLQTIFSGCSIDFINESDGYAGTWDGRIFKTSDAGETWIEEEFPSAMPIYAIDFVDVKRGWSFGSTGTILKRDPNSTNISIDQISAQIKNYSLSQNYPNPFNPSTVISYQLPISGKVSIKVYDILGREIVALIMEEKPAGNYEVEFDGTVLPSGIYFYRLQAGEFIESKKMVLLK